MGYLLLPLTLSADVLAGYASYYYGASVLPYLWPLCARFLGPVLLWLISRPVFFAAHVSLPPWPPSPIPYFQHPAWPLGGQIWLGLFLVSHLYYAVKHLYWRYNPTHQGTPQPGSPGEDKYELVQRRWRDYAEALERFYQKGSMWIPIWRYTTEANAPTVELRGRLLLIREDALEPGGVRDLAPSLARVLGAYNSHDWLFSDILDYYPSRLMKWHIFLGVGIWMPTFIKVTTWPLWHWRRRELAYDRLAWMCGQAQQLYDQLAAQPRTARPFFSALPLLQTRLGQLEALIRTEHRWMQEHQLIDAHVEPPILHQPGQAVPPQLAAGQPGKKRGAAPKGSDEVVSDEVVSDELFGSFWNDTRDRRTW